MSGNPVRVAIVGARGIGKHHAKWWALEGADVCAIVGTSEASMNTTRAALRELFPFDGASFTDMAKMLEVTDPDIVDVCSPPPCHAGHVRAALEAGADVLCEKPFVYDPQLSHEVLLTQARELAELAVSRLCHLGMCAQYAAGGQMFCRIWKDHFANKPITKYCGHLASPAKGRAPDPERVWVDLSPHPLSVLRVLAPEGRIRWESVTVEFEGYRAVAWFYVERPGEVPLECEIIAENTTEPPQNIRKFGFNDEVFTVEGETDDRGVYRARIETSLGNSIERDMMHWIIHRFKKKAPLVGSAEARINLEWMLRFLQIARTGTRAGSGS
ncbi:MAG: Gfo/Idh/MocA family oxidoreductase [Candidatus Hydrogenedentes bacterium]|nr:Gfo/Idh/MocA family oxidoreductase [Candidatus Hydrogenedentota bacterium]